MFLEECFDGPRFDGRLRWFNEPPLFRLDDEGLTIAPRGGSDLWQRTHYGFRRDDAHGLLLPISGDFSLETEVTFRPVHQYDQAGLLVRLSAECWLKTSIEFELDSPSRLGSVVTNAGWSDWATRDVPASVRSARFRITRQAGDYLIEHAEPDGHFSQLRVARLHDDDGSQLVSAGLYACSPKSAGFTASFRYLKAQPPAET